MRGRACSLLAAILLVACAHVGSIDIGLDLDNPASVIASLHAQDPTPERPKIGCIMPTIEQQSQADGKILPEIVRVIGIYEHPGGDEWKVLRAGEFNPGKWVPLPKWRVQFVGCGPEAEAYGASASSPRIPPRR